MKELHIICFLFHINIEQLLDAYEHNYFVNNGLAKTDRCYNLGLNHLFSLICDVNSLSRFLQALRFLHEILFENKDETIGTLSINDVENTITNYSIDSDRIIFNLSDGNNFQITAENLKKITPYFIHMSYFFELHATITDNRSVIFCLY